MTQKEVIEVLKITLSDKMMNDPNYIRYTFYEVNVKFPQEYGLQKQDIGMFLQLLRKELKKEKYRIYSEGQKFEYDNAKRVVESNEVLVAIKQ